MVNHEKSQGYMEASGVIYTFQRSFLKHGLRYEGCIREGDCSAHNGVNASNPYPRFKIKRLQRVENY